MIVILQMLKVVLGVWIVALSMRRNRLKGKYEKVAQKVAEVENNLKANEVRKNRPDYRNHARLSRLIEKQDVAFAKHQRAEKGVTRTKDWLSNLRHARGQLIPYTLGMVDALALWSLLDPQMAENLINLSHQLLIAFNS